MTSPLISSLNQALKEEMVVSLVVNAQGELLVKPMGILERICHWRDTSFHQERLLTIADAVATALSNQQRLSIEKASEDLSLITARKFLKKLSQEKIVGEPISRLKKEICATKIGISSSLFDKNPGLLTFVQKHHLERYLIHYGHGIHLDETGTISLLKEKKIIPWSAIDEEMKSWPTYTHHPQLAWYYGEEGVQRKDLYAWSELTPYKHGDPSEWDHQYVFEICACYNPNSVKNGNHSWVRLKTPEGEIYSVGLYRPDKPNLYHNFKSPFRAKPGYLMQPDVSEFWGFSVASVGASISKEDFLKIKRQLEEDKKNEDLVFHLLNSNCLMYCKDLGALAGLDFSTESTLLSFAIPESFIEKADQVLNRLPYFLQQLCLAIRNLALNLFQLCFGANGLDQDLNMKQRVKVMPHISSFKELFQTEKVVLHHPSTFTFKTTKQVDEWRRRELEAALNEEDRKRIRWSLPPKEKMV